MIIIDTGIFPKWLFKYPCRFIGNQRQSLWVTRKSFNRGVSYKIIWRLLQAICKVIVNVSQTISPLFPRWNWLDRIVPSHRSSEEGRPVWEPSSRSLFLIAEATLPGATVLEWIFGNSSRERWSLHQSLRVPRSHCFEYSRHILIDRSNYNWHRVSIPFSTISWSGIIPWVVFESLSLLLEFFAKWKFSIKLDRN